jgi:hypothetical protein
MLSEANRITAAAYPACGLYEAAGLTCHPGGTQAEDIREWCFVFNRPMPRPQMNHTVFLYHAEGRFSPPLEYPGPWPEDVIITLPVRVGLREAAGLKERVGYGDPFTRLALRWPLYPGAGEPAYIFTDDTRGLYVFVGAESKRVSVHPLRFPLRR